MDGTCSGIRDVFIGTPAGSILGGILFSLYVNDLPSSVENGYTVMFVDDSNFIYFGNLRIQDTLQQQINEDMKRVCEYMNENSLVINADKTKMITLSSSRQVRLLEGFSFDINGFSITGSESLKCLGLVFDKTLSWKYHIEKVSKCCFIRIRALYTIRKYLTLEQLTSIGQSYVLSICNYMVSVYGTTKNIFLKVISKVTRRLARLVLQVKKFDPVAKRMYDELEWLLPVDLCNFKTLCTTFMLYKNRSVELFKDYFYGSSLSRRKYDLCYTFYPKKETGKRAFHYRSIYLWNELPNEIKSVESYNVFKKRVKSWLLRKYLDKIK